MTSGFVDAEPDTEGLERLDPVCWMDVDPATARWKTEFGGRTVAMLAGAAGFGLMDDYPSVRRAMLLLSLLMVGLAFVQSWRHRGSRLKRYVGGASMALALGTLVWSAAQLGV
jgi:hypothetical protein